MLFYLHRSQAKQITNAKSLWAILRCVSVFLPWWRKECAVKLLQIFNLFSFFRLNGGFIKTDKKTKTEEIRRVYVLKKAGKIISIFRINYLENHLMPTTGQPIISTHFERWAESSFFHSVLITSMVHFFQFFLTNSCRSTKKGERKITRKNNCNFYCFPELHSKSGDLNNSFPSSMHTYWRQIGRFSRETWKWTHINIIPSVQIFS